GPALLALGGMGGLTAWTAASIAWARTPDLAWIEANHTALALGALALGLVLGRRVARPRARVAAGPPAPAGGAGPPGPPAPPPPPGPPGATPRPRPPRRPAGPPERHGPGRSDGRPGRPGARRRAPPRRQRGGRPDRGRAADARADRLAQRVHRPRGRAGPRGLGRALAPAGGRGADSRRSRRRAGDRLRADRGRDHRLTAPGRGRATRRRAGPRSAPSRRHRGRGAGAAGTRTLVRADRRAAPGAPARRPRAGRRGRGAGRRRRRRGGHAGGPRVPPAPRAAD